MSTQMADIVSLPVADRIQLVEDIWDSIAEFPEAVALTAAQRTELDVRLAELDESPGEGLPWSEVKQRILAGR